ncbi:hypothetical protein [Nocardia aobensis]|uniref:hypothetical protein n=1 Tax=Nocardia aobensis TaxID=257277 RepID=UPI0012F6F448|nr:hypothetical protein [Nocardia aobensis]
MPVLIARRPVHDPVRRNFTAEGQNRLWLNDITEHRTGERNVYLCTAKNGSCNQVIGYSIDSYMKSPAVRESDAAVARRGDVAGGGSARRSGAVQRAGPAAVGQVNNGGAIVTRSKP